MEPKICKNCKHSIYDTQADGSYVCNNSDSIKFSAWVEYNDTCDTYEHRQNNTVGKGVPFQRVRRITGYLVGDLSRFNDGKYKEVIERRKHEVK